MKLSTGFFLTILYILSISLYYLDKTGTLKYFQYILPALGLVISLHNIYKTWALSGEMSKLCNTIMVLIFINLIVILIKSDLYIKFLQEGFLFLGSIVFSIILIGNLTIKVPKALTYILYCLIFTFLLDKGIVLLDVLLNPNKILLGLITSNIQTESSLSFYFSILGIYFVFSKNKPKAFLSILFMILSFKRIAIAGFLIVILLNKSFTVLNINYSRKTYSLALTIFNFIYLWTLLMLIDGSLDQIILESFGVSSNFLFMGRVDLYSNVLSETGYFNVFGIGIGKISYILNKFIDTGVGEGILVNLHSDILKYYLEFGLLLFPIFLYNFIYYLSKNKYSFCLTVMINIIFLTDNVSIYFTFMVLFYLLNFALNSYFSSDFRTSKTLSTKGRFDTRFYSEIVIGDNKGLEHVAL